ncbi:septum formation initiator family protein [Actinomycetospora sp.]|uniref:FtsB family cell division protein n=1 Tax=Actinomycetospora sp. TaxID=1872135 RepID=UPI002F41274C
MPTRPRSQPPKPDPASGRESAGGRSAAAGAGRSGSSTGAARSGTTSGAARSGSSSGAARSGTTTATATTAGSSTASGQAGAAGRPRTRVRARQGPRRDPQRTALRRHPLSGRQSGTAPAAAQAAARAARATRGALGLSTARRAALLAVVVCALALTVAVPLRNYVSQRHELAAVAEQQHRLDTDAAALRGERAAMDDPAHVEALARARLGYARPGETPYRVELPGDAANQPTSVGAAALAPSEADLPWYTRVARGTLGTAP